MSFKKGEIVVCVINSRATLTIGKEYLIKDVFFYDDYSDDHDNEKTYCDLTLNNDNGVEHRYDSFRFMSKSNFREFKINEILK